jgi:4'-phosphopantetheinyl transferase EntD
VLERILPAAAVVVATTGEREVELFPEEEAVVGNAVEKRRREFVTARACAREALAQLGHPEQPVPTGARGEPVWPAGTIGSITVPARSHRRASCSRLGSMPRWTSRFRPV